MATEPRRQVVRYAFYRAAPSWQGLPDPEREAGKREFASVVEEVSSHLEVRSYSLVGLRADADLLLWCIGHSVEEHQELEALLRRTGLGRHLELPYAYLAMTRRSQYVDAHRHRGQEGTRPQLQPGGQRYVIVYPFAKTRAWYRLPPEERQRMMDVHFAIGHRYPGVHINTTYSFGLDDQEFVLAFETDSLAEFQDLVMELRETEASAYTLRDTPIFAGIARPVRECLDALG
ncbi:MAG: chlorite dismutase family protein [Chloroflexi bacterium]|nr:chlorite dismutase family protein [Chloroflexota bacterium]